MNNTKGQWLIQRSSIWAINYGILAPKDMVGPFKFWRWLVKNSSFLACLVLSSFDLVGPAHVCLCCQYLYLQLQLLFVFVFVFVCCAQSRWICPAHVSASLPIDWRRREYSATGLDHPARPSIAAPCRTSTFKSIATASWAWFVAYIRDTSRQFCGSWRGSWPCSGEVYGKDWWPKGWRPEEASEAAPQ